MRENPKIRISGNIISELSEKIPSNIIALNELIKNSYDAGASCVNIALNTDSRILIISDDGSGMDLDDINTLLHISNSSKKYGTVNKYDRYTQGSKGLGFLSVFKFGRDVEWTTKKETGLRFKLNYDALVSAQDITSHDVSIEDANISNKGTTIKITLDEYNTNSFKTYFSKKENYKKVICAFDDKSFAITLDIDSKKFSSLEQPALTDNAKEHQAFYIKYNSTDQNITFYCNNHIAFTEHYKFTSTRFKLNIELMTFHLPPYGKNQIDRLFYNPQEDLTPLLYVNSNLFANYTMFDPGIMKNIRSGQALNQMIGYIRIVSNDSKINFNSDRTQFLQNELTDEIIDFLSQINKKIQTLGTDNKADFIKLKFITTDTIPHKYKDTTDLNAFKMFIRNDFKHKNKVQIKKDESAVVYELLGRTRRVPFEQHTPAPTLPKLQPVRINLTTKSENIQIPSKQINLYDYISTVYDSTATLRPATEIIISENGCDIEGGILCSITTPCKKRIDYTFNDTTGKAVEQLTINFYAPKSEIIGAPQTAQKLITLPSKEGYTISFNDHLGKLISQINTLDHAQYKEIISCSLRALFEISIDSLEKSSKYPQIRPAEHSKLEDMVAATIHFTKSNKDYLTKIHQSTKIDFHSLKNMLDKDKFISTIEKAHLGAHKSSTYLSLTTLEDIAKDAALFVVIANELLTNPNITRE
ncbi:ATP-binding protein [Nitratidesulfovibrio sp.]|uniref:ATP-binding protein n=1 Tax=Nitratidesulfovibrio sp. TaxID=2802297 RepID=UPI00334087EC